MKKVCALAVDQVPVVFDDRRVTELARDGKMPEGTDLVRFARSMRGAVADYARRVHTLSPNEIHREVRALHRTAFRLDYDRVAILLDRLPSDVRNWLDGNAMRSGWQSTRGMPARLPSADALRDIARRHEACVLVRQLCTTGGEIVEGRRRGNGRRSRSHKHLLCAPQPSRHFAKRDAELGLIVSLQVSFAIATGRMPALTAHPDSPGPFARMVQKVLHLVCSRANAVGLINELNKRRRELNRRASARDGSQPPGS